MAQCPNCGQETKGDFCEWCGYPLVKGRPARKAGLGERTKQEAETARKARITELKAKLDARKQGKLAEKATKERTKQEAETARKARITELKAKLDARKQEQLAEKATKERTKQEAEAARKARITELKAKLDARKQ
ncbi:MAG: hypothetical protein HW402_1416, partial [Dehalococcoidales bacterium]|nr:hypothetical protein [Dehalococcoidales bacterium]